MQELNDVFACVEEALTADQRKKLLEKESECSNFRACGAEFRVHGVCFQHRLTSAEKDVSYTSLIVDCRVWFRRRFERDRFEDSPSTFLCFSTCSG